MRICCTLSCEQIPRAYRTMFVSFIKKCLETADENYYKELYFFQDKQNKKSKQFTFSVALKNYKLVEDLFIIKDRVEWYVSSPDQKWMIHFYNGLLKTEQLVYRNFVLTREKIRIVKEKEINSSVVVCKTLSPIYIKDQKGRALSPDDESYEKELQYISNLNLMNFRGYGLKSSLRFVPIEMKQTIVKEPIVKFQKQTQRPYLLLEGYKGRFLLEGDPEDLRDLYQLGLGFRRSSGWGMFEVI